MSTEMEVLKIRIEAAESNRVIAFLESTNSDLSLNVDLWSISLETPGKQSEYKPFFVDGQNRMIELPPIFEPGVFCRVLVKGLVELKGGTGADCTKSGYMVVSSGTTSFQSELSWSLGDLTLDLKLEKLTPDRNRILFDCRDSPEHWQVIFCRKFGGEFVSVRVFYVDGILRQFDLPVFLETEVEYRAEVRGLVKVGSSGSNECECFWIVCSKSICFSGGTLSVLSNYTVDLKLEQTTYREVDLALRISGTDQIPDFWVVTINDADTYKISGSVEKYHLPGWFPAGPTTHTIRVLGMLAVKGQRAETEAFVIAWQQSINYKAELTLDDLRRLHANAVAFATYDGSPAFVNKQCQWLYRNKSPEYFEEIFKDKRDIMEVRLKDNSGDQGSPINGQLKGLFFMASVDRKSNFGNPIPVSPFGSARICIPANELVNSSMNLYFTDFYCMKPDSYHYVTLVVTQPNSDKDIFCSERLVKLSLTDPSKNPFLFLDEHSGELRVSSRQLLLVEVFYTQNIDITSYRSRLKHNVRVIGSGGYTEGGIRKNRYCTKCNLYPETHQKTPII